MSQSAEGREGLCMCLPRFLATVPLTSCVLSAPRLPAMAINSGDRRSRNFYQKPLPETYTTATKAYAHVSGTNFCAS